MPLKRETVVDVPKGRGMSSVRVDLEGAVKWPATRAVLLAAMLVIAPMGASRAADGLIYSCTDAFGRKLTSDRPIADCNAREQRVLNADGSVHRVLPPSPTADERAAVEAREQAAVAERAAALDSLRRDRNLLARFPNEVSHRRAREAALEDSRKSVQASEGRMTVLEKERKPLMSETEFFAGKPLPAKLKQQIEANDASMSALRSLVSNQQSEIGRINERYDAELERLRKLWSEALAGTASTASVPPDTAQRKAPK